MKTLHKFSQGSLLRAPEGHGGGSLTEEVKGLKAARGGGDGIGNVDDGDMGEDESHDAAASRIFSR
jgi:hypothetical protein